MEDATLQLKIVVIGDAFVGKTSLTTRYVDNVFDPNERFTVGVEVKKKTIVINEEEVGINFYDTAGQEKYRCISDIYYRGAHGCIIVYDITRRVTFDSIDRWFNEMKGVIQENIPILIVGNKSDNQQQREVLVEQGSNLAKEIGAFFIETSCLKGNNVKEAISIIVNKIVEEMKLKTIENVKEGSVVLEKPQTEETKQCC
ncbi:Rab family GTPase [Entamoeba marina]